MRKNSHNVNTKKFFIMKILPPLNDNISVVVEGNLKDDHDEYIYNFSIIKIVDPL